MCLFTECLRYLIMYIVLNKTGEYTVFPGDRGHSDKHLMKHSTVYFKLCNFLLTAVNLYGLQVRSHHLLYQREKACHAAREKVVLQYIFVCSSVILFTVTKKS